jgi:hypothetical protein
MIDEARRHGTTSIECAVADNDQTPGPSPATHPRGADAALAEPRRVGFLSALVARRKTRGFR